MALAGLIPLDLRIQEAAELYETKKGKHSDAYKGRQIERTVCFTKSNHPARMQEINYECLKTDSELPNTHIYTDGSRIDDKVGAAYSLWDSGTETKSKKIKLESFCTVFQAELYAIHQATELLLKYRAKTVAVLSDSRSALDLIKNPNTLHPIAVDIRNNLELLREKGLIVQFFWVKAHVGVPGNERADELAKEAALHTKTASQYDRFPASYAKKMIRAKTIEAWNERYLKGDTAQVTKLFLPGIPEAYKITRTIELTPLLTQVFTGHGGFSGYLSRFKCKEDPSCVCEDGIEETVQHLLLDCPKYGAMRHDLESVTNMKLTTSALYEMLTGKETRPCFIAYCTNVAQDAVQRNKTR